jgi:hypothetical protein
VHVPRGIAELIRELRTEVVEHVGDDDAGALGDEGAGMRRALAAAPARLAALRAQGVV